MPRTPNHTPTITTTKLGSKTVLVNDIAEPGLAGPGVITNLLWAHSAGAPMDHPVANQLGQALAAQHIRCIRFEFDYMAARRHGGKKRPPPRIEQLVDEWEHWLQEFDATDPAWASLTTAPFMIGGKSMGGRVATLLNIKTPNTAPKWQGVMCLGYPFHPPQKPEKLRTAHLLYQQTPVQILHGTRDPFGTPDEVASYDLGTNVHVHWLETANHDLTPLKRSGLQQSTIIEQAAKQIREAATAPLRAKKDEPIQNN